MRYLLHRWFLSAVLLLLPACGRGRDEKARREIHAAGYAFSVEDFLRAAREGKAGIVEEFLHAGMNPNAAGEGGGTAVSSAAAAGHGHVVALLLARGGRPDPERGQAALLAAAQSGDLQAVKALLGAGAGPAVRDSTGLSPLAAAVLAGQTAVVALLAPGAVEALDHALQLASVKGHTAVMAVLLDLGASPHAAGGDGRTAMMFAAQNGHFEAVKLLRQRGGVVTALDSSGQTPAAYAEENGYPEVAAYLREPDRSADPVPPAVLPKRLNAVVFPEEDPVSLAVLAAPWKMTAYEAVRLPLEVTGVAGDDASATVRLLTGGGETLEVVPGMDLPGTGWRVVRTTRRFMPSRHDPARMVDVSEVLLEEAGRGRRCLAVKGLPVLTGEGCALVQLPGSDEAVEVRQDDQGKAGSLTFKVTGVRPAKLVLQGADGGTVEVVRRGAD